MINDRIKPNISICFKCDKFVTYPTHHYYKGNKTTTDYYIMTCHVNHERDNFVRLYPNHSLIYVDIHIPKHCPYKLEHTVSKS